MMMFSSTILILALTSSLVNCNEHGHLPIQFDSRDGKGAYNFGYDTGVAGAHQFHQETRDEFGRVRGRYGYTDPNGKLRLVYYSSGVNGYKAWGNVPGTVSEPDPGYSQPIEFLKAPYESPLPVSTETVTINRIPESPARRIGRVKVVSSKLVADSVDNDQPPIVVEERLLPPVNGKVVRKVVKSKIVHSPIKGQILLPPPPVKGKLILPSPPPVKGRIVALPPPPVKGQQIILPPAPVKGKIVHLPPPPPPAPLPVFPVKGQQLIVPPPPVKSKIIHLPPPPPPPLPVFPVKGQQLVIPPPPPVKGKIVQVSQAPIVELLPPPPPVKGKVILPPVAKVHYAEPLPVKGQIVLPPVKVQQVITPLPVKGKIVQAQVVELPPPPPPPVKGKVVQVPSFPVKGKVVQVAAPSPVKGVEYPFVQAKVVEIPPPLPVKGGIVQAQVVELPPPPQIKSEPIALQLPVKGKLIDYTPIKSDQVHHLKTESFVTRYPPSPSHTFSRRVAVSPAEVREYRGNYPSAGPYSSIYY